MIMTAFMIAAAAASASMSVGATVVREDPAARPAIALARESATISNIAGATVSAEGGTVRRTGNGIVTVTPKRGDRLIVTLTY